MKKKVLIVEDDNALAKIIQQKLDKNNVETVIASSGKSGLSSAKTDKPDLILLDIMLPGGMNGFDLLQQLKADEKLKSIPVIILTNLDTEKKTALDFGAIDYIIKPNMSLDEVILKIKNCLL